MKTTLRMLTVAFSLAIVTVAVAEETVKLKPVSTGAMKKMGGYMPQRLQLTDRKPDDLVKAPELTAPLYGVLSIGPKAAPTKIVVIVDEPEGKPAKLYVDSNGNGDLTDDGATEWEPKPNTTKDGETYTMSMGGADITLKYGENKVPAHLGMYRFDKKDPQRAGLKNFLLYYADYAQEGQIKLGDKTYTIMLADRAATGDYKAQSEVGRPSVELLIDVDQNGKFFSKAEIYSIAKPFNIGGVTYRITDVDPSGSSFKIDTAGIQVAEIFPPPDLSVGSTILAFKAKTTDGVERSVPESYKGKLVLIDFWATWCGPCIAELPNLIPAYETYHDKGLEILGISLDNEKMEEKLAAFTKEKKMNWPHVYDGKGWDAELAKFFEIQAIPRALLVDGDTGKIVATGESLRGEKLAKTIQAELEKKKKP